MVDEHADFTQHSIFVSGINCNTDDSKKDRLKFNSDVTHQNDDNHNTHNKDKLLSIVEYLTGESKHVF